MKIYQILPNLYLGEVIEVPDNTAGIPIGWTRTAVEVPEGNYAVWTGTGWNLIDQPPEPVIELQQKIITSSAFFDRLGSEKFNIILSNELHIKNFVQSVQTAGFVDLEDVMLVSNLEMIVSYGFQIDIAKILFEPVRPEEIYALTPESPTGP